MTEYVYDEAYYRDHLGPIPCSFESKEWSYFFLNVANEIKERYNPFRVIDAGCGIGLLVDCLLSTGMKALGFDSSKYAVQVAHNNGLQYYVASTSLESADALNWKADFICCVEVLEHIAEDKADVCIKNLCNMSTQYILFSSSPDDLTEPSHINVQPEDYWLKLFSGHGFEKVDTATWLCPQAIILEKKNVQV